MEKTQIVIGSTQHEGGLNDYLEATARTERIRAHVYIDRGGMVSRLREADEDSSFVCAAGRRQTQAIGIVLEGGGPLERRDNGLWYYEGGSVPRQPYEYCSRSPHCGHQWWEYFGPRQLESLVAEIRRLSELMSERPRYSNQFTTLCRDAMNGVPAVWLRLSYAPRYRDAHPQPDLVRAVKQAVMAN